MSPINLDQLSIAAPCDANWKDMSGDERSRACSLCKKNVYNISAMSRTEAESLIRANEGDICIRLFKRADGTVIVDNCPVGLRAIRNRLRWIGAGVAAALTFLGTAAFAALSSSATPASSGTLVNSSSATPTKSGTLKAWLYPAVAPEPVPVQMMMGKCAAPVSTPAPTPAQRD